MTKRKKILVTVAASFGGLLVVLVVASILILQSAWFANYVREKVIATTQESTGGTVEIGSFQFDWTHLTVRIRNFVLHGTEPKGSDPLARVPLLELRLKLLAGLKQAVDLQYLGVHQPTVNLIVFPDGKTNIPEPKVKTQPSQKSGLQTVVDLAVGQFQIDNGTLQYAQQKTPFNARGQNLRVLLNYSVLNPSYQGNLSIDPLLVTSGKQPPLSVHVNIPVTIEKDAVTIAGAKLNTDQSQILLDASIRDMNKPQISGHLNASVSLVEMGRSLDLPIDANAKGAPKTLTAEALVNVGSNNSIQVQTAHVALGGTTFQASGTLRDANRASAVQFNGNLALAELGRLLKVSSVQASGALQLNGNAKLDGQNNYAVNGTLNSRDLSVRSGTTRLSNVGIYSPFHADPYLISLDGLKLNAFGGSLAAKVFVEKMQQLSVEGNLHNFSLPVLAQTFTGHHLGYDGNIDGYIKARGDLNAKGTTGYRAEARLSIAPGRRGVPVSGRLNANYNGANGAVDLAKSYVALPNSRLEISGALNRRIDLNLVSQNLNDFLPAANFGAAKPESSLPIALQGGTATVQAQITGNLAAPRITSHIDVGRFAIQQHSFDRFAADLAATPSGAAIQNGVLTRKTLQTAFDASIGLRKWSPLPLSPLTANVQMRNGDLTDLLSLAGESSIPASGQLSADVHISGTYGNPLGSAALQVINGTAYQQPFERLSANVSLADQLITLSPLELDAAGGRLDVTGTFAHPRDSFTVGHAQLHVVTTNVQLADVKPLQQGGGGVAGVVHLTADAAADLRSSGKENQVTISNVSADLSASGLRVQNQDAGNLTAMARTSSGTVNYTVTSNFAGSNVNVNGRTALTDDYPTTADASIQNLDVAKTLRIAGQSAVPARGTLSATAHVAGTLQAPNADLTFSLDRANVYGETINRLGGTVHYSNTSVNIPSVDLNTPAGTLTLAGSFTHPAGDFNAGSINLRVNSSDIQLAKIQHVQVQSPGATGTLRLAADLSATLRDQTASPSFLVSNLNADLSAGSLRLNNRNFGNASLAAHTTGGNLDFRIDSDIAQSQIHGAGQAKLSGDYPVQAKLTFGNIRYVNLAPFITTEPETAPTFDASVAGQLSVSGPLLKTDQLSGNLQLSQLEARTLPQGSATGAPPTRVVLFHNEGPVAISLDRSVLNIQHFVIAGPGTNITAGGSVNLKNATAPMNVTLAANTDLGVLQDVDRDFYSSGNFNLNAVIHGTFAQPLVNGRVELKNANVNYTASPNGLSNGNGVILLNGTSANIQNLTGESGGGKIAVTGFVGFVQSNVNFNLKATANRVRTRYSGISVVTNSTITLTGNTRRSLLAGRVSAQRIAYASTSDAGSILSTASTPPVAPSAPSPLLSNMRLDLRITTAPDLRVVTTYADRLAVSADLTVRGTAATPGMLGTVRVTDGQLVFFGNTYTVNTGNINFYSPNAIQPILNVSLETIAQGVDVVIGVTGPMNDLKLTYRSDPPLTFQQIVQLLATNTTPGDPVIAAHQPTPPQESLSQMGESAILGQAVANPLASRVQRVFGISQFKIDPSFQGSNGQPSARVTLQQKITNNVTFTYITDVTQTNSEIIRIEWAFTPAISAVALRDYNGNVSVNVGYKFKIR